MGEARTDSRSDGGIATCRGPLPLSESARCRTAPRLVCNRRSRKWSRRCTSETPGRKGLLVLLLSCQGPLSYNQVQRVERRVSIEERTNERTKGFSEMGHNENKK